MLRVCCFGRLEWKVERAEEAVWVGKGVMVEAPAWWGTNFTQTCFHEGKVSVS